MNWFLFPAISLKIKWNNVEGVQCVMCTTTLFEARQRKRQKNGTIKTKKYGFDPVVLLLPCGYCSHFFWCSTCICVSHGTVGKINIKSITLIYEIALAASKIFAVLLLKVICKLNSTHKIFVCILWTWKW